MMMPLIADLPSKSGLWKLLASLPQIREEFAKYFGEERIRKQEGSTGQAVW